MSTCCKTFVYLEDMFYDRLQWLMHHLFLKKFIVQYPTPPTTIGVINTTTGDLWPQLHELFPPQNTLKTKYAYLSKLYLLLWGPTCPNGLRGGEQQNSDSQEGVAWHGSFLESYWTDVNFGLVLASPLAHDGRLGGPIKGLHSRMRRSTTYWQRPKVVRGRFGGTQEAPRKFAKEKQSYRKLGRRNKTPITRPARGAAVKLSFMFKCSGSCRFGF